MKGWIKLGDMFDKKREEASGDAAPRAAAPPPQEKSNLVDRLASMVAAVEKRLKDAFENGQAARRFNSAELLVLPVHQLEEVRQAAPNRPVSVGRFEHVRQLRFQGLEEVRATDFNNKN